MPRAVRRCTVTAALIVGCLAGDVHWRAVPGSEERPCHQCGRAALFTPATLARPEAKDSGSRFSCLECADFEGLEIRPPSAAQVAELAEAGHDPNDWPFREQWGARATRAKA